jgi:phosphotransferase system enzyme I (PtsI)
MDVFDGTHSSENGSKAPPELRLAAQVVSRGIAIGKVVCLHGLKRQFYRVEIRESQVDREVRRFRASIRLALRQLKSLQTSSTGKRSAVGIVDVHRMILQDASLLIKVEEAIRNEHVNAEWAVKLATDSYIAKFKAMPDEHLRSRYVDIEDVAQRMITALGGGRNAVLRLDKDSIVVAKEINPSTLIELGNSEPSGLITEHGGWTSHTFILAREISIPAITGIRRVLRRVQTGDTVIIDALHGQMILNPSAESLSEYQNTAIELRIAADAVPSSEGIAARTLDDREIVIRANVDFPSAYKVAKRHGAKGIGLYRSEFLFNQFRGFPSEAEQIAAYSQIADLAGENGVKIRTFDLSADQLTDQNFEKEKNPALGLRAIRLSLTYRRLFQTQLRAILMAAHQRRIDLLLPMISDISEIDQAKSILEEERDYLVKRGIPFGNPGIGAMIEIPAAVLVIDAIVSTVDFLCIGTNDLVQYLLAVDRDNESVADWFQTLHPAVVRAVRTTLDAAAKRHIPAIVCGEMAGSPFYVPLLIGLGATDLSMNVNSISRIRTVIGGVRYSDTIDLVKRISECSTADESLLAMKEAVDRSWSHLIPPDVLNATRTRGN